MASGSSFDCPVAACGQTFISYRGLTGHWKYIHEPTVNLYRCAGCEKTFLKKQSGLKHTRGRCRGGLVTMVAVNKRFVNPGRYSMPTAPAVSSVASPREQAAEARHRIREVAEQGQLAQMVDKPGPINNRDETITMVGDKVFKAPKKNWLPWLNEEPEEIQLDFEDL